MDEQDITGTRPHWEHHIEYIQAEAYVKGKPVEGLFATTYELTVKDFMQAYYAQQKVPTYAVQAILPRINELGEQGWELVQMLPVRLGEDGNIQVGYGGIFWTHTYQCSFKRLKRSAQS